MVSGPIIGGRSRSGVPRRKLPSFLSGEETWWPWSEWVGTVVSSDAWHSVSPSGLQRVGVETTSDVSDCQLCRLPVHSYGSEGVGPDVPMGDENRTGRKSPRTRGHVTAAM